MTQARKYMCNSNLCVHYLITNRCVQRAYLLETNTETGEIDNHRKLWVQDRIKELTGIFTLIVGSFSVMSNHMHIALQTRPDLTEKLTDEEVAKRWLKLYPPKKSRTQKLTDEQWKAFESNITSNKDLTIKYRERLGCLSWFMKSLSEPIARMSNEESKCTGRFWQGRFNSKILTSSAAVIASMIYTDLNPIRANMAETPETSKFTGAYERIQSDQALEKFNAQKELIDTEIKEDKKKEILELEKIAKSSDWLAPFYQGETHLRPFTKTVKKDYFDLLDWTGRELDPNKSGSIPFDIPHIFERLQIEKEQWLETIKNFDNWFYRIVGKMSEAWRQLINTVNRCFKGSKINRKLFGD